MTEQFLYHLGVDTETKQEGWGTIAQIVKTNIGEIRFFQKFLELIDHMAGSEMRTSERAEDIIILLPQFACLLPGLFLA